MFSDAIKRALETEVAGQPRAVNSVVRGVTRVISGLTPRERTICSYLFVGPSGTGKTHVVQSLSRILHGDERRMIVVDCSHLVRNDPWLALAAQLTPLFATSSFNGQRAVETPPLSIICIQHLERGPKELSRGLAATLKTGQVMLPQGRQGILSNCLVFLTTGLCTGEILDETTPIGFSGAQGDINDDEEEGRIYQLCLDQAEENFGYDLVGLLDGLIVFHRLEEEHLGDILDRRFQRLNQWLATRGFRCDLLSAARDFLLERGRRNLRRGTRDLVRAHQRLVEFPLADLMVSGRIGPGGRVVVDRRNDEEHLHFTVKEGEPAACGHGPQIHTRHVPVERQRV